MGSLVRYACCGKEMLDWIHEKMAIQDVTPRGDRFSACSSTVVGNGTSTCSDLCALGEDYSITIGNGS
jgi:hypothetical protein